ncbi:MAG: aminodeoxychorismate synthase component I [Deltaproteobacteria bacterium]|nr:aminodeoxychorismate synthase component I [Deltaproteobacteria bacterium]
MNHLNELDPYWTPERLPRPLWEEPYFFFLDSSLPGKNARWSIAASSPRKILRSDQTEDLWSVFRRQAKVELQSASPFPFTGGWIGYLGYEFYRFFTKKVPERKADLIPEAVFCFYDEFYLYDHLKKRAYGTSELSRQWFNKIPPLPPLQKGGGGDLKKGPVSSNFTPETYCETIQKIKNYITAGDCYQVNLSQRFSSPTTSSAFTLYHQLREISPAPYSAYLNLGEVQILSASPESFLNVRDHHVMTRPIKGTRPRGKSPEEDACLKEELWCSKKDRAELLMITDLLRNDLGRVCERGSVKVPSLLEVESYAQVHHLISTIEGKLAGDKNIFDLLEATFPGGSITGAPKIRAMQIIHELETVPRNLYTGTIGFLSEAQAHFNIAIRTMIYKQFPSSLSSPPVEEGKPAVRQAGEGGGMIYFWGGGGIVADSDPVSEYQETLHKTAGFLKIVGF